MPKVVRRELTMHSLVYQDLPVRFPIVFGNDPDHLLQEGRLTDLRNGT